MSGFLTPSEAFRLLSEVTAAPDSTAKLAQLASSSQVRTEQGAFEQTLLVQACAHALTLLPNLPVSDNVKQLFLDEFSQYSTPPERWLPHFRLTDVRFREMARIATLRRFPAGQFHWETAAFPRSWALHARQPFRLLAALTRMGGFGPVFEIHLNERRKNRMMLLESEARRSYYRVARSIELQPHVRGMMTASWLFCKSTSLVTPRLAWLRAIPEAGGAEIIDVGVAPADSGFATGSEERRKLYEEGTYRPRVACVLWPRQELIRWADQNPDAGL